MTRLLEIGEAYKESDLEVGIKYLIKKVIDSPMIYSGEVDGKHEFIEEDITKRGRINGWRIEEEINFSKDGKIIDCMMSYQPYHPNDRGYEDKKELIEKACGRA